MNADLAILRAERLCLLTDIMKAQRAHRSYKGLKARLRVCTARLAAMEGSND